MRTARHPLYDYRGIGLGIALVAAGSIFCLASTTTNIPVGKRGVVLRLGKVQDRILNEGLHFHLPFVTDIRTLSVQVQKTDAAVRVGTKDLQTLEANISLNWHIAPDKVNALYQQVGTEEIIVSRIIEPAIQEVVKAATPKRTTEEIIKNRATLKAEIDKNLEQRLAQYSLIVDDISIVNIAFSPEFTKSIEAKQIAEQAVKEAEYVAQKAAQEATAEVNRAKGQAEAAIARAKGQAEAQRLLQQSLTPQLLEQQAIEKWNGVYPSVVTGDGAVPMINISPNRSTGQ